jgi:transposase-like protein
MVSFSGRHYPKFIILQCVRWYVSYALSYCNIEEMMEERGYATRPQPPRRYLSQS